MIPAAPTTLSGNLDVTACRVDLTVHALEGCCGVRVLFRALVISDQLANIALPDFGPSCYLWVQPTIVLAQSPADTFSFTVPPGLPPLSFYAQAFALSVEPFSTAAVPTLSSAHAVDLR